MYIIKNKKTGAVRIGTRIALCETVLIAQRFETLYEAMQAMKTGGKNE